MGWDEARMVHCAERRERVSDMVVRGVCERRAIRESIAATAGGGGGVLLKSFS